MPPIKTYPSWRKGWTWTLIKCGAATLASTAAATAGLLVLLRELIGRLPGWLPSPVVERLFRWCLRYVWLLGPIAGLVLGLVVSGGIILYDARKGRLSRLL